MKKPPSSRPIDLKGLPAGLALAASVLAGCAERADRIAVCPLAGSAAAEAAPAGFVPLAWAPVGTVHHPRGWEARIGPHSESVLRIRSPDNALDMSFEASCCSGSDLLRDKAAEVASWSGRTFWIGESGEGARRVQRYFAFPFAQVDPEKLRSRPGTPFRPPIGLSATASCLTPQACATAREIVRSIRYDAQASRLAQRGDEGVARLGASAAAKAGAAGEATGTPGGPPPPPAPPPPQPTFTPELCRSS